MAGFALVSHIWYVIVYVPLGVFAATVTIPLASILNGPLLAGVTSVLAVVTVVPFNVSFPKTLPPVAGNVSLVATSTFATTTVAVAVLQLAGFAPVSHISYVIVYVPLGVFAATVTIPLASILNGPLLAGVTSVFTVVTVVPFNVSFPKTLPPVAGNVSVFATSVFVTTTVATAVSQFAGIAPISHN